MSQAKSLGALVLVVAIGAGIGWLARLAAPAPDRIPPSANDAVRRLLTSRLPDAEGKPQSLAHWRGRHHPLLINFWASWCAPCREEMPRLNRLALQQGSHGIQILGIAWDNAANLADYAHQNPTNYPLLLADAQITALLPALGNPSKGLPFSILLDAEGRIQRIRLGILRPDDLDKWQLHSVPNGSQME
jgi:thiol-disulfide isomerase/thioredoxin